MMNDDLRKIAWQLKIRPENLHERIALNAATTQRGDYVSFQVNRETGELMTESSPPPGVAAKRRTLTTDAVSDVSTLAEIERMLGLEKGTLAERLREEQHDG